MSSCNTSNKIWRQHSDKLKTFICSKVNGDDACHDMGSTNIIRKFQLTLLFVSIVFFGFSQSIHPLEPAGKYYKTYGAINTSPAAARAWMDTITFPWSEYSQNAITNSLVRTVYLKPEDEAKLPGLIHPPANSSDQTRAELDYLLSLQNARTKEQIDRAQYIANIGS